MAPDIRSSKLPAALVGRNKDKTCIYTISGNLNFAKVLFISLLFSMVAANAKAQVVAGFTIDDTAGCAPLVVHFTNTSTGATSYTWNVGNGTAPFVSTNAVGTYLTAGTYTVTLVASNGSASSTYTSIVKAYAAPTVIFSGSDTAICPYSPVTFTSTSIPGSWGSLTYNWNFGDGLTSTATSPVHSYPSPGYYNVSLFATNAKGCINSLAKPNYIHVLTPATIGFHATTTSFCKAPASVSFINTTTGTAPLTYNWNFGDGGTSTATNPVHSYTTPGSYTVQIIATDGKGCKDTMVLTNYITIGDLTAAFTPVATSCGGTPVTFTNTSSSHISSQWFFGDGSSSAADLGVHTYTTNGSYTVKLVVFDGTCYDTVTHPISISYPTGNFTITPAVPCPPPSLLTFNATVSSGSTVSWIFSGGTTGTGTTITHTYPAAQIYSTSMVMTDGSGCKDTVIKLDTLYNLNINPAPATSAGCVPLATSFSCYAYAVVFDPYTLTSLFLTYPAAIVSYSWNFGDGSPLSTSPTPSHTYTAVGSYAINLSVTTANGCTITGTNTVKVGSLQTASFTAVPTQICAGKSISLHSTSTSTALIDEYNWSFADGGAPVSGPADSNVVHVFTYTGIHAINLAVDYNGCISSVFSINDTIDSPSAIIHYSYDCIPANGITFGDSSLGDNSHLWMFGDGTTSTLSGINHLYPSLSSYTVTLATYNAASGCRDTVSTSLNLTKPSFYFIEPFDSLLCKDMSDSIITPLSASQYKWYDNGILKDSLHTMLIDTFHVVGLHSIYLVIQDTHGCLDTSYTVHVLAAKPVDSFSLTPPSGCGPLAVHFTDHTTDVTGATLSSYFWTFGDGTAGAVGPPVITHTYSTAGTYMVQEIVTDNIGCADTFISATRPVVHLPSASFYVSATTVCSSTAIHFTNTSVGISGSLWFFGDGTTSSVTSPSHTYASAGVYSIKLVVYDAFGCGSDTLSMPGYITVIASPAASFSLSDSFAVCAPLNVTFTNTTTGAISYYWIFGDGTSSLAASPSDVYITPGLYNAQLIATGSNGCTDTASHHVDLFGYAGAFSYTPVSGCSPFTAHFSAILASVEFATWDFADGSTSGSILDTVSHTYHVPGNYLPKLVLTDSFGCTTGSQGADTIRVDSVLPQFTFIPSPACQNYPVTFHDASSSAGYFHMTGWLWSFAPGATSTLSAPTYTYTTSGTKTITLVVTDSAGCSNTITHTLTVNPTPPAISGSATLCQGTTLLYSDSSPGGAWLSSNLSVATIGSSSGLATGLAPGTTILTYIGTSGCQVTMTVTVTPSPSAITGVTGMCISVSSPYTDTTAGGIWSIAPTSIATVSPTGTVTGVSSGVAALSYTVGGCSAVKSVTISATPSLITGLSAVCVGDSITLTDTITGGTWSSTSPHVSVGSSSGIVTGISSGTAVIITYSLGTGCTKTKSITVNPLLPITGPSGVCIGGNITLSDPITGSGTWISSATSVATIGSLTGTVTGISAGTTTIYYILPTGCTANFPVTVHNLPSPIGGTLHVCQGDTTTLTDTASGGIWSIAPVSVATIGSLSGLVTGVSSGTAFVTYSLGSTGCQKMATINVNPVPLPIGGVAHVCLGKTTTLSDMTSGGSWSGSSGIATVGSSGIVLGMSVGTTIVTYALATTGCKATDVVTVNPLPSSITGSSTLCISLTTLLTDTTTGGTWSSSNTSVATVGAGTGLVTGTGSGVATITYTLPTGCITTSTMSVNTTPAPITGTTHVCVGSSILLSDGTTGGSWISSDAATATVVPGTGVVTGVVADTVTIIYSDGGTCASSILITVNPFPGTIAGASHVCMGSTTSLSDLPPGGTWATSNPLVAIVGSSSGIVTGENAGSAVITYSLGIGCNAYASMSVNPLPPAISGVSFMCLGATTTLGDVGPGGIWGSSNSFIAPVSPSGVVTGLSGGAAVISYTISTGCAATRTMSVIAVPAISGLADLCAWGDTLDVLDSFSGGIYTSSLFTVTTHAGGAGTVTAYAPGVGTITYILPSGCYSTSVVTINPLPDPISGDFHLCVGLTTALSDFTTGGSWSISGSGTATVGPATGIVTGVSAGTTFITYSLPVTGCHIDTAIYVSPLPSAISGTASLCSGAATSLADSTTGGTWSSSNPAIASVGAGTGFVSGIAAGDAIITYTVGSLCSATKTVTVNPLPIVFITTGGGNYCFGGAGVPVWLSGSQVGVRYQLYYGTSPVDTALPGTGVSLDFGLQTGAGTYTVVAANASTSCVAAMAESAVININPLPVSFVVTGGGSYCAGGAGADIGLSGSVAGVNYQLYHGTTPVGADTAGTGAPLDFGFHTPAGYYKVLGRYPATTCSNYMTDSVDITITPTVTPSLHINLVPGDTVCAGTSVTFTPTPVNGGSLPVYQWNVNGTGGTIAPNFTYAPANSDVVSALLTSNATCAVPDTAGASVTMTVDPQLLPSVTITAIPGTTIAPGQPDTFIAVVTNAGASPTYKWEINGAVAAGATTDTFTADNLSNTDAVSCIVTSNGPCGGLDGSRSVTVTVTDVGVMLVNNAGAITVLPNPNKGEFTVKGSLGSTLDEDVSLEITDMLGQVVYKNKVIARSGIINERVNPGTNLANGVYLLSLHSDSQNKVFHIVIER